MAAKSGFTKAFSRVALGTLFSRILGLVREQVFAHLFGASMAADAFFAAFRIPNLLRDLFAEGALSSAFVPVFKQDIKERGKASAFELAQVCFTVLTIVLAVIIILGALLAPYLVKIIAFGFGDIPGKAELTTRLTVIMFPFLLLVALAALAMSILNSFDRFGIPALAPALFNMGSIAAAYFICPYMEEPIVGMALGVLLGGLGQFAIQIPSLHRIGFRFRFKPDFKHEGLRRVGRLMLPMVSGLAAGRVNIFVNTLLASLLAAGSVSYLTYSYRIMHLPLGMVAVALGTVALPKASEQAANNDRAGIAATFYRAIHLCFFLVFPVAAFFIACGVDIVGILFQHGKFGPEDTLNTYHALNWYSLGLIGFAGVRVTAPVYYALKDAVHPMRYSIISVAVNLVANFLFIPFFNFAGLAAATALGGLVNFAQLLHALPRLVTEINLGKVVNLFVRTVVAAAIIGLALYLIGMHPRMTGLGDHFKGRLLRLSIQFVIGVSGYFVVSYFLGSIPALRSTKKQ
ncbi:MAG: murein biosynthesis integral membrane protein MurJ [candidate division Zixibacteria bacterium]|nr:murein biosynthesis integral membrane protein MurJ [candidate division Zixibacteria bacterium]